MTYFWSPRTLIYILFYSIVNCDIITSFCNLLRSIIPFLSPYKLKAPIFFNPIISFDHIPIFCYPYANAFCYQFQVCGGYPTNQETIAMILTSHNSNSNAIHFQIKVLSLCAINWFIQLWIMRVQEIAKNQSQCYQIHLQKREWKKCTGERMKELKKDQSYGGPNIVYLSRSLAVKPAPCQDSYSFPLHY